MKEKAQALINVNPKNPEALFWLGMAEGSESVFIISVDRKLLAAKTHADKSFDLMEIGFPPGCQLQRPSLPHGDAYASAGNDEEYSHG